MSTMIKLTDGCWIDPAEVMEVKVNDRANCINVRMNNGIGHTVMADYGQSIYSTLDRLMMKINSGRKGEPQ